jgi:hypothetical protein
MIKNGEVFYDFHAATSEAKAEEFMLWKRRTQNVQIVKIEMTKTAEQINAELMERFPSAYVVA